MNYKTKNTPALRFPEFNGEWEMKKLGEVAEISSGGTPSRTNQNYWNGNIPWVSTTLIDFNFIDKTEEYITQEGLKNSSAKLFPVGTLLMAMYGQGKTRGKIAVLNIEATTNQACGAIITNSNRLNSLFAFQNLSKRYDEIRDLSNQGGQENLSGGILKGIEINFPTLPEQQKTATFLTGVDEKLQALKQKKSLLEQYKKGVMQRIFSKDVALQRLRFTDDNGNDFADWEEKKLGEILQIQGGFAFKSNLFNLGKTKVIRIGDITPNIYLESFKGAISGEIPDLKYLVKKDDFLMALSGATFGKVGKVKDGGMGYINQRVALFRTIECLEYFFQLVQTDDFKNYINSIPTASAQPNISNGDILNYETKIPCHEEQTKIANFLSAIDEKINQCQAQIVNTEVWKKGLLQRMFV